VRVGSWVDDDFTMDEAGVRLTGRRTRRRFSLGDKITVRIARVDLAARELELALDRPAGARAHGGRKAKKQRAQSAAGRHAALKGRGPKSKHKAKGRGR